MVLKDKITPLPELQFPNEHPEKVVKIRCSSCGHIGNPTKWDGRIVLGIIFLLIGLVPGLVFFSSTNPYACESCDKREYLTKIRNNGKEFLLGGSPKIKFVLVSLFVIFIFFIIALQGLKDRGAIHKSNKALEIAEQGEFENAGKLSEEAANEATVIENQIELYKNAGFMYATELQIEKALENFKQAINLTDYGSFNYYLLQGEISLLEGEPSVSLENYLKAYELVPDDYQINNSLGLFYMDLEDVYPSLANYDKAVDYLERTLELNQSSNIAKENLGIAYILIEDFDRALDLLLDVEMKNNPYLYFWIGIAYLGKGDEQNGLQYLEKAFEIDPELETTMLQYLE